MTKPAPAFNWRTSERAGVEQVNQWEPLNPVGVEADIRRLSDALEEINGQFPQACRAKALAEARYKHAWASSLLMAQGKTVGDREAVAALETSTEFEARLVTEAEVDAIKEVSRNVRSQLDSLRSINANTRHLLERG